MSKITPQNLLCHLSAVEGWLRDDEALLLYQLASYAKPKSVIVEIGSWKGRSTVALASAAKVPVYAIDPHTGSPEHRRQNKPVDTYQDFLSNLKHLRVLKKVKPLRLTSNKAANYITKPISLLYIDGNHSYGSVLQDFTLYFPKLMFGGTIAFHDTIDWPGPKKIVTKQLYFGNHFKRVRMVGSITYAEKTRFLTLSERLKNYYAFFLRLLRNRIANTPLPKPIKSHLKNIFLRIQ